MMFRGGLVSISFRKLTPAEIIEMVSKSGLQSIEWGGDVHVPHGNVKRAREVRGMTLDSGLAIASYGSYYHVAESEIEGLAFERVLDSAHELDVPIIRVWAGQKDSAAADADYRQKVVDDSRRIADLAAAAGIRVAYEFHGGTLTDTNESAIALLRQVDHPNIYTYWQPAVGKDVEYCAEGLKSILQKLVLLHVFHWQVIDDQRVCLPLDPGRESWFRYFEIAKAAGKDYDALIEFVRGDTPEQFMADARALSNWLQELNSDNS